MGSAGEGATSGARPFRGKILLVFALSALITAALTAGVLYTDQRRLALEELISRQESFAVLLAHATERELAEAVADLVLLADHPAFADLPHAGRVDRTINGVPLGLEPEKRRAFDAFREHNPFFSVLFLLQPDGDHYLSHPFAVQRNLQKFNLSDRPYFRAVTRTRRTVVSDSFFGADGVLAVAIDVPLLDESGEIRAHLGGVLHLEDLSKFVEASRIGESNMGFIVDGHGLLIAHSDPTLVGSAVREQFSVHPLLRRIEGANGAGAASAEKIPVKTAAYTSPWDDREYVGTVVAMENGWSLALGRRTSELESIVTAQSLRAALAVALLILFASGVTLAIVYKLGRGWERVQGALQRDNEEMRRQVRERRAHLVDTDARLQREIADRERADLELQAHRENLEDLVKVRARELVETNARLEEEIAERKRTDAAFRERDAHLRTVLSNAPIILFATDREGRFTISEGKGLKARGRVPGQVVGLSLFEMYLDRPDIVSNVRLALAGKRVVTEVEVAGLTYETAYLPLRDEREEIVGMVGVANDVTERARAEEALRLGEKSLVRAQGIAHLGNWDWNLSRNEITWSDEMYRILAISPDRGTPSYDAFLAAVHPDDREAVREAFGRLLEDRAALAMEHRVRRPDGSERIVDLRAEVVLGAGDKPASVAATVHDITDRMAAEEELKTFAAKLEETNRELQEFAYMTSHDLQEPLNTMHRLSEQVWLRLDDRIGDEDRRDFAQILGTASRMKILIDRILALSRVTTHALPFVDVDLEHVAREVVSDLRIRIEEARGRVDLGSLPRVEGDPVQMQQLLQNLIANGLKFCRPQEPPVVKVTARLRPALGAEETAEAPAAEWCDLIVEDNGIGFDEADAERIFTSFQRLHDGTEYKGSGLGLATCRKIAERHGGTIRATSRPGEGSRFIVSLPVHRANAAAGD